MVRRDLQEYDEEWMLLIKEAKKLGLSMEEVQVFLEEGRVPDLVKNKQ
ncbi:anti-repressor SinI family protein [Halobacillus sp. H74]